VGEMVNLQVLKLGNNPIDDIPLSFSKLAALTTFDLRTMRLTNLPNSFKQLTTLKELLLQGNLALENLPDFIEFNINLTKLDVSGCSLTIIPGFIGGLINLITLDLRKNQLSSYAIPPRINELQNLGLLYLANNNLEALPDEICELKNLTDLDISNNLMIILPDDIGHLLKLEKLYINSNRKSCSFLNIKNWNSYLLR
jgi:leucine-rich repeat protein SHOC2